MNSAEQAANIINNLVASDVARQKHEFFYFTEIIEYTRDQTIPEDIRKYINVLAQATSYNFKPEETYKPFEGLEQHIQEESLNALDEVCAYLSSAVLKARIQDILWLRTKKVEHAEKAIEFYKDCATKYFNISNYYFSIECAERALRLASLFRKKNPQLCQSIADILLEWIRTYSEFEEKFLTANAIELLAKFNYGTTELYGAELYGISKKTAQYLESKNNFYCAERYRIIATRLADKDTAFEAQTALAECYVKLARSQKNTLGAVDWMKQAITAYKKLPNTKEIRAQLYAELLEYQKASLPHFSLIEYPIDLSDTVKIVKIFEGKNIRDALLTLAFKENQPNYTDIREQAKENIKKYPLQSLVGKVYLDNEGKIIAQPKINSSVDVDDIHPSKLYEIASIQHQIRVLGFIRPAVEIILLEHPLTENDFLSIVMNNPFVEPTQVLLYAKGLYAGMIGDYVVSTSILIPLLENSIRYVLKCSGEQVSSLSSNGIQEVLLMNALLEHKKTQEIFGEDTVLDLKGLLIDRTYGNLRNNVSHGLTSSETFRTEIVIYLWWLILRLCLFPFYNLLRVDNNSSSGSD